MITAVRARTIIAQSNIAFGTSGARGLVEQFTDEVCAAFAVAFLSQLQHSATVKRVAIGLDRRPSSPAMAAACAGAARAMGLQVDYYGILPTPALAWQAMKDGVPAIMITGSHIPFDRNGIKFYRPDGEITKADEQAIVQSAAKLPAFEPALPPETSRARESYIARNLSLFSAGLLSGWRIGVYEHSAAGRDINIEVLSHLGAEVVSLGRTDTFVPIDTEAVTEEDKARGRAWSREHKLNAIFSTDGDGDRPLVADENGEWLRGDILGLLCARFLGIEALAVPVSCNTAIEACGHFANVLRTRIGSPYVIEGMQQLAGQHRQVAGFEANGGFLMHDLPTRDALLPALALFAAAREVNQPISALLANLPSRFTASDRIKNFPTEQSRALLATWQQNTAELEAALNLPAPIANINTTDGLRATLENGSIVHLRPSGNAPELRCYVEASSTALADNLVAHSLARLAGLPG
ncbi:phosphomannomutase [Oceanimonas pelagia]|uniref:Phosphomannomutase n=1 Tax=Oceanimonas pelagia TaxID=3028314 RepID=A0AA50KK08_9GAMM|nr:phosphomannomutase [Oceanimonas pelagia]WMC09225.1 phosphomannomutase [Oceanimonas pelagia]